MEDGYSERLCKVHMGKFLLEQGLEKQGAGDKLLLMSRQIAKGLASRV